LISLRDPDISIRRRALDILYLLCTPAISERIIEELIKYSNEAALNIKEELVLKIIILAEKFAEDILFYIDVVVRLIETSGNYITEEIWYRII
jgi:AP-2 complex subunit alpha